MEGKELWNTQPILEKNKKQKRKTRGVVAVEESLAIP